MAIIKTVQYYTLDDIPEDVLHMMTSSEKSMKEYERCVVIYRGGKVDRIWMERLTAYALAKLEWYKNHKLLTYPEATRADVIKEFMSVAMIEPFAWEQIK